MHDNFNKMKYLNYSEIDFEKWDKCIDRAPNSRLYATSWFLDRMATRWNALIWGDYKYIMPVPYRKKLGIKYSYQPLYCQQLGIFPSPPANIAEAFFSALYQKFHFTDIQLNAENHPGENSKNMQIVPRKNYLLQLNTDFETIYSGFSKNTRRNIAKAEQNNISYIENISLEEFLHFKRNNLTGKILASDFQKLISIIAYSLHHGFGKITGVYSQENELCAAVFFCRWKNRVIYLNAVSSKEGKAYRAMFFLIHHFCQSMAGSNLTLDFEGSVLPGIARFFEGFGATPEIYYRLHFNHLPFPLNLIKK